MKVVKKVLMGILALVVLLLVAALILPSEYRVQREVVVHAPKDSVFHFLKFLKNQDRFSVWNQMDPDMKKTFRGTDGMVGAVAGWKSDNKDVGSGEQEIIKIEEGRRIDFELRFFEPWESKAYAFFTTEAVDSASTKVTWGVFGKMPYPWNLMLLTMDLDKMMGKDLAQGLKNLKAILEQ